MTSDVEQEKAMATYSSTLAWKIPRTEETGGLQSMGFARQEYWSGLPLPSPMYSAYKLNKQGDNRQP